ncbi:MAG TPA: iron-sulfur cluster assembly protein [Solirubrobacteraceae bacterium]|jgi:metal-sulfur cluster biosynthetic enzyme|nr:iron-sulfur cluster assembly protein [Solirubrobacteraceae bacterium]
MTTVQEVVRALAEVRDPELDEPLTTLGFVSAVRVTQVRVEVWLRLPTYFCAPNFAWLMVDGARAAVLALDGVQEADVRLADHFAADEINGAATLAHAFPGRSQGELTELRDVFARKAFVARQARLCEALLHAGRTPEEVSALRLSDLDPGPEVERCRTLRAELGIAASPRDPAFVLPDGRPLDGDGLRRWLRVARLVGLSIEGNAGICRGLLRTRYGLRDPEGAG